MPGVLEQSTEGGVWLVAISELEGGAAKAAVVSIVNGKFGTVQVLVPIILEGVHPMAKHSFQD